MVPQIYRIRVNEGAAANWKKLRDKLKHIKAEKAIIKEKGSLANAVKSKIDAPQDKKHTKNSVFFGIGKSR